MTNEEKEKFFLENIEKEDPLQIVVRGHLFLENELINLLEATFSQTDCLDPSDLRFPLKIKLVGALGLLPKESIPIYLKFNSLRNKFAHNLDMEITAKEVENLINSLSEHQAYVFWGENKEDRLEEGHIENLRCLISIMFILLTNAVEGIKKKGYIITNGEMGIRLTKILVNYNLKMHEDIKQKFGLEAHDPESLKRIKRIKEELEREN
jgi:hypothetical protein